MKALPPKALIGLLCLVLGGYAFSCAQTNLPAAAPAAGAPKFAYGGDAAEIAAQFFENLAFLSARINDSAPSLFQLDTVAATSSIAPDRAAEIERVNVPDPVLNLTGLDFPFASLPVDPKPDFEPRIGMAYQGTFGRDFLAPLVVQIDYARETVRAYAPANYKYSGKGLVFPLSQTNGIPVISLRFALERGKEVNANFIVDTALDASLVFNDKFLAAHKMNDDRGKTMPTIDPFSGAPNASLGRVRTLMFAKDIVGDVIAVFSDQAFPDAGTPVAGAIGSGMLRRFIVTFDFPHHQLILEPNIHFPEPDQEDKSGLLVIAKGTNYKTFEVVNVQPNSPAALAGIKKGDVIAGIDTDPAGDLSLLTVRDLFRQVGHKYKLTIQRGDQTQEITVQMHRYF
jgi:PDZ domain